MTAINEIAPDVFRISICVPDFNLQFNHFVIRDEEPMLYHTGMRGMFPAVHEAVAKVIDPATLRWIGLSHFEVDECGALNEWLEVAPSAQPVCSAVGAMVNLSDYAIRPPRGLTKEDVLTTGRHRFRLIPTPHLPHGWDAAMMFEEEDRTLLCSDLFHHVGDVEALTESDILGRVREALTTYQAGPLMDYMPLTSKTDGLIRELAELNPQTLAVMHGSSFRGDCAQALLDFGGIMRDVLGEVPKG